MPVSPAGSQRRRRSRERCARAPASWKRASSSVMDRRSSSEMRMEREVKSQTARETGAPPPPPHSERDAESRRGAMVGPRWRFLAEASEFLDASLEYQETLANVVRLAVPT